MCIYYFLKKKRKNVRKSKPVKDELEKGIKMIENISKLDLLNSNVNETDKSVTNAIYLN